MKKVVVITGGGHRRHHGNGKMLKTVAVGVASGAVAALMLPTWVTISALVVGGVAVANGLKKWKA